MRVTATRPNFMIIGAQKAASTALLTSLRQHPEVWMPHQEDPFLRDPVFDEQGVGDFLERYRGHAERLVGLKCPDYLARPEVPNRISELLGRPKLILIVREPVARALSAYFWQVRWGALPVTNPNEGLSTLMDGGYREANPISGEILEWGLYYRHLQTYLTRFDRSDLLILHDRDLWEQEDATLGEVARFLGIGEFPRGLSTRRSNAGVYSLQRLKFLQLRNSVILDWNADRSYYTIFKPRNPVKRGYSNLIAAIDRWVLEPVLGNDMPTISSEVRSRITDYFLEDSTLFQQALGHRLVGWPGDESTLESSGFSEGSS